MCLFTRKTGQRKKKPRVRREEPGVRMCRRTANPSTAKPNRHTPATEGTQKSASTPSSSAGKPHTISHNTPMFCLCGAAVSLPCCVVGECVCVCVSLCFSCEWGVNDTCTSCCESMFFFVMHFSGGVEEYGRGPHVYLCVFVCA